MKTQAARYVWRATAVLAAAGAGLCGAVLFAATNRPFDGDPVDGQVLYLERWASWHGREGQGGGNSPRLTDGGLVNSMADTRFLELMTGGSGGKNLHKGLKQAFASDNSGLDLSCRFDLAKRSLSVQ